MTDSTLPVHSKFCFDLYCTRHIATVLMIMNDTQKTPAQVEDDAPSLQSVYML